ncbi:MULTISPECIES: DinB family protein [unclassified Micromonospora]|uniref:DinB family protein n=1 Tax=Micromonospora sp. NPDC005206 TaxID=3157022 RepID=UPI0033AF4B5C
MTGGVGNPHGRCGGQKPFDAVHAVWEGRLVPASGGDLLRWQLELTWSLFEYHLVPTIGWITWHIGWWWTVAIDHLQGRPARERTEVNWPGDGDKTVAWLRDLRTEWLAVFDRLSETDLDGTAPFPWQDDPEHTVAHMIAWVNAELMKNVAEVGQLRLLRHAGG